jgi:hypothetical protein
MATYGHGGLARYIGKEHPMRAKDFGMEMEPAYYAAVEHVILIYLLVEAGHLSTPEMLFSGFSGQILSRKIKWHFSMYSN